MKPLPKLLISLVLLSACFSTFAGSQFKVDQGAWNERKLGKFIEKYQLGEVDVEGAATPDGAIEERFAGQTIIGYQLRYGVYMLQTLLNTGVIDPVLNHPIRLKEDLILTNLDAAKRFEQELKATTTNRGKFYIRDSPVPIVGAIDRTIAIGYVAPGPTGKTVQIKHYFIDNPWGWKAGKNE